MYFTATCSHFCATAKSTNFDPK